MIKKTVRLTEETNELLKNRGSRTSQAQFMRNAIEKAVKPNTEKMKIKITIDFVNTGFYTDHTLTVITHAVGNLKEKIIPLLDAIEDLQEIITYLDP